MLEFLFPFLASLHFQSNEGPTLLYDHSPAVDPVPCIDNSDFGHMQKHMRVAGNENPIPLFCDFIQTTVVLQSFLVCCWIPAIQVTIVEGFCLLKESGD